MQSVLHSVIGPKKELHDLSGRVALVTGGGNGIGFQISRLLCQANARVIMVSRKDEHGSESIDQIKQETPNAQVEFVSCDLGNLKQIKEVFGGLREKEDRLDLVGYRTSLSSPC